LADSVFLIRSHKDQKEVALYFSSAERKEPPVKMSFKNEEKVKASSEGKLRDLSPASLSSKSS
jgi:hypothetical protein